MHAESEAYYLLLGIPPSEQPPHHYRLLGLRPFESNRDVIINAADRVMSDLKKHALGPHSAWSERLLSDVARAKLCLLNPAHKQAYDQDLWQRMNPPSTPAGTTHSAASAVAGVPDGFEYIEINTAGTSHPPAPPSSNHPRRVIPTLVALGAAVAVLILLIIIIPLGPGRTRNGGGGKTDSLTVSNGGHVPVPGRTDGTPQSYHSPPVAPSSATPANTNPPPPAVPAGSGVATAEPDPAAPATPEASTEQPVSPSPAADQFAGRDEQDLPPLRPATESPRNDAPAAPRVVNPNCDLSAAHWTELIEKTVHVGKDVRRGTWTRDGTAIRTAPLADGSQLTLPVVLSGCYELEVNFTRHQGQGVAFTVPVENQTARVVLGGFSNAVHGIGHIDGSDYFQNTTTTAGRLEDEHVHQVNIRVCWCGGAAVIRVKLDGADCLQWSGNPTSLSVPRRFACPERGRISLGADDADCTFHRARIGVLDPRSSLTDIEKYRSSYMTTPMFGGHEGLYFRDFAPEGGELVGMKVYCDPTICGVQPLYRTEEGIAPGVLHGSRAGSESTQIAQEGYALRGINLKSSNSIDGLQLIFAKRNAKERDSAEPYLSDWFGRGNENHAVTLGSPEQPVVGLVGAADKELNALAMVVERPKGAHFVRLTDLEPLSASAARPVTTNTTERDSWPLISLNYETCKEFVFAHAPSRVVYDIPKAAKSFSTIGYCTFSRHVGFRILVDGQLLYPKANESSPKDIAPIYVELPTGSRLLEMVVDDLGFMGLDHSFWLYPRFHTRPIAQFSDTYTSPGHVKLVGRQWLEEKAHGGTRVNKFVPGWSDHFPPLDPRTIEPCNEFLFAHAPSELVFPIPRGATGFTAIGYCSSQTVKFRLVADGVPIYESPATGLERISVGFRRKSPALLKLVVDPLGEPRHDWSYWCYPRIHLAP